MLRHIEWIGNEQGFLRLLDQTRLPTETVFVDCRTVPEVWHAIRTLQVRGAPAIGVSAAYGLLLSVNNLPAPSRAQFDQALTDGAAELAGSRPTAVNLFWALDRMQRVAREHAQLSPADCLRRLFEEACAIEAEDREMCLAIGRHGAPLLGGLRNVLTHCNAGALATGGDGTALSVIFEAVRRGEQLTVFADETRPLWQGARLTAWELVERGIPCNILCDNTAGWLMKQGKVQAVVVGADRIAANGDVANKIGTYSVAVLARAHDVPFYVAAPTSTFDLSLSDGSLIPIEERAAEEVVRPQGRLIAPEGAGVYSPAFDVTPAGLITAIVTERGVISPVNRQTVAAATSPRSPAEPADGGEPPR